MMLEVFDRNLQKTAALQNAYSVTETLKLNDVDQLTFSLPEDDPKGGYCLPFHYVRDPDTGRFFRIISGGWERSGAGAATFSAEHVIATLVDDLMFGAVTLGGLGYSTKQVLQAILARQQTKHWTLGTCDFDKYFEYAFESDNLLNALFAVPNLFTEAYQWAYDTTGYPWRVSLKKIDVQGTPQFYIRAGKNLLQSREECKYDTLCTRLYLRGYGEGVNQLTISEVNGGLPYLQSPKAVTDLYGIISKEYVDRRFEDAPSLLAYGQALLASLQEPQYTRTFQVCDLEQITGQEYDRAEIGRVVRLTEDNTQAYITGIRRNRDKAGDMTLEMSTQTVDAAKQLADIASRQRIEQVYAQGATTIYGHSIQANADTDTAAVLHFLIPQEMRIVNKVVAKISLERYRAYSKATKGGGKTTRTSSSGGGETSTSATGGGGTHTASSGGGGVKTSRASGRIATGTGSAGETALSVAAREVKYGNQTSMPMRDGYETTVTEMALTTNTGYGGGRTGTNSTAYTSYNGHVDGGMHRHTLGDHTHDGGSHTHSVGAHQHGFHHTHYFTVTVTFPAHSHTVPAHSHSVNIDAHTHDVDLPNHTHTVTMPTHSHSVTVRNHTHTVEVPDHTHGIEYGIFRTGSPKGAVIQVNGVNKLTMTTEREVDITEYLVGGGGTIPRGSFIRLGVLPDDLAYITIDVYIQGFVQSRGGGTY